MQKDYTDFFDGKKMFIVLFQWFKYICSEI